MADKKYSVGSPVMWRDVDGRVYSAEVVKHGRDSTGTYTEIETEDGERVKVHRSSLRAPEEVGIKVGLQHV